MSYDSAPLRFSDHRPVYATFECRVSIVDEALRESISQELYERRKAEVGDSTAHVGDGEDTEDEDLIGYDAIEPGLPPASSDRQKWWLDNRQPARAQVSIPNGRDGRPMALNPNRAPNPFGHSDEPDWISVPRSSPGASLSSISSSPYEKVSLPMAMQTQAGAPSAVARKLPPPYDAGKLPAKVGRTRLDDEQSIRSQPDSLPGPGPPPPPPPRPRRQGTAGSRPGTSVDGGAGRLEKTQTLPPLPATPRLASAASSQTSQLSQQLKGSGKSPPPVAKKPAHLATSSPLTKSSTGGTGNGTTRSDDGGFQPPLPTRSATMSSRAGLEQQTPATSTSALARKPVSPPRPSLGATGPDRHARATRAAGDGARVRVPVDLLDALNEGGEEMGGWETLQPSTRG